MLTRGSTRILSRRFRNRWRAPGYRPRHRRAGPIDYSVMRPGCYDVKARLADMDANHTEASLCFPTFPRFCGQTFLEARDKELALACVEAFNDWTIEEWCGESAGRLLPLCLVPLWDPDAAAREVRRNAARGCHGSRSVNCRRTSDCLRSTPDTGTRSFAACEETGTVVCMHIGSGSRLPTSSPDAPPGVLISLTFTNAQISLADWLLSGVLVRFPTLRIAYSESQIGWMPFLLERLDNIFKKSRAWIGIDPVITEPAEYVFRRTRVRVLLRGRLRRPGTRRHRHRPDHLRDGLSPSRHDLAPLGRFRPLLFLRPER